MTPPDHITRAVDRYASDPSETLATVGRWIGYHPRTVRRWLTSAGVPYRSERPKRYQPRQEPDPRRTVDPARLREMLDDGESHADAAREFGVTRQAIQWWVRRLK